MSPNTFYDLREKPHKPWEFHKIVPNLRGIPQKKPFLFESLQQRIHGLRQGSGSYRNRRRSRPINSANFFEFFFFFLASHWETFLPPKRCPSLVYSPCLSLLLNHTLCPPEMHPQTNTIRPKLPFPRSFIPDYPFILLIGKPPFPALTDVATQNPKNSVSSCGHWKAMAFLFPWSFFLLFCSLLEALYEI